LAASALASIGVKNDQVLKALVDLLSDEDAHPRGMAFFSLVGLYPKGDLPPGVRQKLEAVIEKESNPQMRDGMKQTLATMDELNAPGRDTPPPAAADSWIGEFKNAQLSVRITPAAEGYQGVITLGEQRLPFTAAVSGGRMTGQFVSGNNRFEFAATLARNTLTLVSGGKTYELARQRTNPLGADEPVPGRDVVVREAGVADAGMSDIKKALDPKTLKLAQFSLPDPHLRCTAWTFVAPANWQMEGGVYWTGRTSPMYTTVMSIRGPDAGQEFTLFPIFTFADTNMPILANGAEIAAMQSASDCVRQITLPRCRREVSDLRIVKEDTPLPRMIAELAERSRGVTLANPRADAARVHVEYTLGGKQYEEMIYCVVAGGSAHNVTFWAIDRCFSYRAEKGKLKDSMRVLGTIGRSLRENPQWIQARRQEMGRIVASKSRPPQVANSGGRSILDVSRQMARDQDAFLKGVDGSIALRDRAGDLAGAYGRNTEIMSNPVTGERIEVNSGYLRYYQDYYGAIYASNDQIGDLYTTYHIPAEELQPVGRQGR
jgi:hypothetical protein